jgi:rod shape-determining protein mreC
MALLGFAWKQRTSIPFVTVPLEKIATPFAYGSARVLSTIQTGIRIIDNAILGLIDSDSKDNMIADLEQKVSNHDEVVAENIRLRQMLNYKSAHPEFTMTLAGIITKDFGTWTNTFTIDRGENDGIKPNMAVVVPSGVVGFVTDVYPNSARVQTFLDPRSAIGVIVQRPESRLAGVVKGDGNHPNKPMMVNIAREGDVLVGDKLITSGYGGIYPKGLLVGNVLSIENDTEGFVKNATIQPTVDFHRLEEVFIITSSTVQTPDKAQLEPKLVPQTQRDQVQGAKGAVIQ